MRSIVFVLSALFVIIFSHAQPVYAERPNLIYIMCDDLGYGDLGCFGQQRIQTPHLNKLADEGMRLTNYYAGNTVCRPSRLVLWTGLHAGHTAINSNAAYVLEPEDVTVAERLKAVGYATGGVGKWALGKVGTSGHPNQQGFDFWMGYLDQGEAHNYYPTHLWRNVEKVPLDGNVLIDDPKARGRVARLDARKTYSHDVMTNEALSFVRTNARNPFLLHIHWTIPHANNEGGRVQNKNGMEVPDYGIYEDENWPDVEKGQAAMITRMDGDVGRLVALLKELGIEKKTLIVFTSDNGPHSEGGHKHEYFDANGPLRGYKRDLYEGGIRVPTIAWWPGVIQAGSTCAEPLAFYDWVPTACELADAPLPHKTDGVSFAPTLIGQGEQKSHDYLYWKYGKKEAVRKGQWKGVRLAPNEPLELYDLNSDLGETNNIASRHPDVVNELDASIAEATK